MPIGIVVGLIVGVIAYIIGRFLGSSSIAIGGLIGAITGSISVALIRNSESRRSRASINQLLLAALLSGCAAISAKAQSTVFVSAKNGIDGGICSSAAPCRTVNFALTQAPNGGQVLIVDSGDYDESITITKDITIAAAPGVAAVFNATGAANTVFIFNYPASFCTSAGECRILTLRNLIFDGQNLAQDAAHAAGIKLIAENCTFTRFKYGVYVVGGGTYQFKNCVFYSLETGVYLAPTTNGAVVRSQTNAVIEDCRFSALSSAGIDVFTGPLGFNTLRVVARYSLFNRAGAAIRSSASTGGSIQVDIERCEITNSSFGVASAFTGSVARVSNSTIVGNLTGLSAGSGGSLLSRSNNTIEANSTNGTFTGLFVAK